MVEVFKTNVTDPKLAGQLIDRIQESFPGHTASFDLDDCDKILRVVNNSREIQAPPIIYLLRKYGFSAKVLVDDTLSHR